MRCPMRCQTPYRDVPLIFHPVRGRIRDEDRWELVEETALGFLSFAKILPWKDMADHEESPLDWKRRA